MPTRFNHQRRHDARCVELLPFVDDIFVSTHESNVFPTLGGDKFVKAIARDAVCDDRRAWALFEHDFRQERDEFVAVDFFAARIDDGASIDVRVEHDPEIRFCVQHALYTRRHGLLVFRIGTVIRKVAIRIEKLRARGVGAERFENHIRKETAAPVPGIDDNLHPSQRFVVIIREVHTFSNDIAQLRGVGR